MEALSSAAWCRAAAPGLRPSCHEPAGLGVASPQRVFPNEELPRPARSPRARAGTACGLVFCADPAGAGAAVSRRLL